MYLHLLTTQGPFVRCAEQIDFMGPVELPFGIGIVDAGKICISTSRLTIDANTITMHTLPATYMPGPTQYLPDPLKKRLHHLKITHHQQCVCGHFVCVYVCGGWRIYARMKRVL